MKFYELLQDFLNVKLELNINLSDFKNKKYKDEVVLNFLLKCSKNLLNVFKKGILDGYIEVHTYKANIKKDFSLYLKEIVENKYKKNDLKNVYSNYYKLKKRIPNNLGLDSKKFKNKIHDVFYICLFLNEKNKELCI